LCESGDPISKISCWFLLLIALYSCIQHSRLISELSEPN
jgi:hypothetical protein